MISAVSRGKLSSGFVTRSDTNCLVHQQKMVRGLNFRIHEVGRLYKLCSENKGTDQLLVCAFVFAVAKSRFSNDASHL